MQHIRRSTEGLPEREQFAYYREEILHNLGLTGESDGAPGFHADMRLSLDPSLRRNEAAGDACAVRRTPRDVGRRGWEDWICLYREKSSGTRFADRRGETLVKTGDLMLFDPAVAFSYECRTGFDNRAWFLPRALFEPHLPPATPWRFLRLERHDGVVGLVRSYAGALDEQLETLDQAALPGIADNFARLLAIACGSAAREHGDAVAAGQLAALKRHIARDLANPELSPASVAAAMKISLRQLHRLFEPTGTSFAQHVAARRLEECHAALADPAAAHRSVADIAFGWGFNSLPTFYRSFGKRYGMSPRDVQERITMQAQHSHEHIRD
jgi:AraC-like DNA-binding protein